MARAAKRSRLQTLRDRATDSVTGRLGTEALGLGLLGTSLLACLALATYSPADPVFELVPVANRGGPVGASMAGWLFGMVGYGAIVIVGATGLLGGRLILGRGLPGPGSRFWLASVLLLAALASLPPLLQSLAPGLLSTGEGGAMGVYLASRAELLLGSWGALLIASLVLVIGCLGVAGVPAGAALGALGTGAMAVGTAVMWVAEAVWAGVLAVVAATVGLFRRFAEGVSEVAERMRAAGSLVEVWRERRARRARVAAIREPLEPDIAQEEEPRSAEAAPPESAERQEATPRRAAGRRSRRGGEPHIVDHEADREVDLEPSQETFRFNELGPARPFRLPELSIFPQPPDEALSYDRDSLLMNSRILEKKLADFGVMGRVVRVHPGPVVTMYEYEPAAGIKVNKIVNLTDDLTMALSALSVRIIAPLPGKSVVGIEVPNRERETVYLRPLLEARTFRASPGKLTLAMGKDIFGNPVESDLSKMPHLLVAGATGTGKSVFLNALLCSLLCRCTPNELKFLMIDPKMLELSIYDGIPHLIAEVVTNPKRAAAALKGVLQKMEERYQMMSALQVRNIEQFNNLVDRELEAGHETFRLKPKPGEEEGQELPFVHLPYIVVVVDELADLMVVASKDVEESLQRLAQMARAAGIHLVLATQRPSVDVLTGVIKANFPARVSFQVSSTADSRTVLDQKGADSLLGHGDMLFLAPGTSQVRRLHGPFVAEKEVMELVAYLRDQGEPEFDEELLRVGEEVEAREARSEEDVDEMFDQAVAIVAETRNASISYVQRRLKIGYNRAARIMEQMELDGMVGPQEGTRPREVYLPTHDEDDA